MSGKSVHHTALEIHCSIMMLFNMHAMKLKFWKDGVAK